MPSGQLWLRLREARMKKPGTEQETPEEEKTPASYGPKESGRGFATFPRIGMHFSSQKSRHPDGLLSAHPQSLQASPHCQLCFSLVFGACEGILSRLCCGYSTSRLG